MIMILKKGDGLGDIRPASNEGEAFAILLARIAQMAHDMGAADGIDDFGELEALHVPAVRDAVREVFFNAGEDRIPAERLLESDYLFGMLGMRNFIRCRMHGDGRPAGALALDCLPEDAAAIVGRGRGRIAAEFGREVAKILAAAFADGPDYAVPAAENAMIVCGAMAMPAPKRRTEAKA